MQQSFTLATPNRHLRVAAICDLRPMRQQPHIRAVAFLNICDLCTSLMTCWAPTSLYWRRWQGKLLGVGGGYVSDYNKWLGGKGVAAGLDATNADGIDGVVG